MITLFDLKYDMSKEEKAKIIKELLATGIKDILVPIGLIESLKSRRKFIRLISANEFIEKNKELFD